ncbi:phosphotransferase family protein [Brachybacterium sp. AOP43-C2-M15]|uniref:phosphotransferase family protein n=1 Tax=Brachybacterium sp. AOP43-C2-M15 TaxID=3457661 RepID=UPI004034C552
MPPSGPQLLDQQLLEQLILEALRSAGDPTPPDQVETVEHGTTSHVVLTDRTAVRIARHRPAGEQLLRTQRLVDALPRLPFDVPVSRGEPVVAEGVTAVPTARLHGRPHPPGHGESAPLRELLEAIHELPIDPQHPDLAVRRAFAGGERWQEVLRDEVPPLLPARVRTEARRRADALCALEIHDEGTCFSHVDLGGENVLWSEGRVSAVLDWDLATHEDPAEDIASLAWWHGWDVIGELTDEPTAARAAVHRDAFPLQMVAFRIVSGDDRRALERTIDRIVPVLER